MKKLIVFFIILTISFSMLYSEDISKDFKYIKKSKDVFKTPESVKYDLKRDLIFVANINGSPTEKDGNGFISKLNSSGDVLKLKWIQNLDAPKGMGIYKNYLYVTNIFEVVKIDINKSKIVKRIDMNGTFLNDIDIDDKGNVFVSDMATKNIYKINKDDEYEKLYRDASVITRPNGLRIKANYLYIGSSEYIFKLNLDNMKVKKVVDGLKNTDGVVFTKNNNIISSNFSGELFFYDIKKNKLLSKKLDHGSADIGIIEKKDILLVPDFKNSIYYYKIK